MAKFINGPCLDERDVTAWLISEGVETLYVVHPDWDSEGDAICQD
jgi:hypothetical protein